MLMAFRSDRRGDEPITSLALEAVTNDWFPARDFHHGPETSYVSLDEAEDTFAVRSRHHICHTALAEGVQICLLGAAARERDVWVADRI